MLKARSAPTQTREQPRDIGTTNPSPLPDWLFQSGRNVPSRLREGIRGEGRSTLRWPIVGSGLTPLSQPTNQQLPRVTKDDSDPFSVNLLRLYPRRLDDLRVDVEAGHVHL